MTDFVAEICSNHNGDLARALALVDTAAAVGCAGVKFQLFRLDRLYTPEVLAHPDYQFLQERRKWELPLDWLPVLKERCIRRGLKFGCTPFYLEAVEQLTPFVDFFKVASYNLLHGDLLAKVAWTGKPVVLSTGMATEDEIERVVTRLTVCGCRDLTLLHCVSAYPARLDSCNPAAIAALWGILNDSHIRSGVGWSDHTVNPGAIYYFTIGRRASMVEFHLDLDGNGWEYDLGHCWLPGQIAPVIEAVRDARTVARGGGAAVEDKERLWRADPVDGLRPVREMRGRL